MNRMPVEVLHLILSELAEDEYWGTFPDLKSMRICNKTISFAASKYVFREILLHFTEASHAKMKAIAQHPVHSKHVRDLRIMPKELCGPFLDREEFGRWLRGHRTLLGIPGTSYKTTGRYIRIPESVELCSHIINSHYAQYSSIYKAQEGFFPSAQILLQAAVGCLPNLKYIVSGMHWPLQRPKEPQSEEDLICREWKRYGQLEVFEMDQTMMILRIIDQIRSHAGATIDFLRMLLDFDTLIIDLPQPNDNILVTQLVAEAKKFTFFFNTRDGARLGELVHSGKYTDFLAAMPKLEVLDCTSDQIDGFGMPTITSIFSNNFWAHLTNLELSKFYATADEVTDLFIRHKATLRCFSLRHILLREGNWSSVFQGLRVEGGALQHVEVYHLGCESEESEEDQDNDDEAANDQEDDEQDAAADDDDEDEEGGGDYLTRFFHDLPAALEKEYWPYHGYLESTHPLHQFLVLGQQWTPDMADILKEQRVNL